MAGEQQGYERTLIIVKPDGVQRGLAGEIIARLERRGLKLVGLKMMWVTKELAERHYEEHKDKPFFPGLVQYITSRPVVVGVVEGPRAIEIVRATVGATKPWEAAPGTIRADFGVSIGRNLIHASTENDAKREVGLFFSADELFSYQREIDMWVFEE